MSMLGVAYLNEIVNKIAINKHISTLNADDILNQLREMVITSLHQTLEVNFGFNRPRPVSYLPLVLSISE